MAQRAFCLKHDQLVIAAELRTRIGQALLKHRRRRTD